MSKRARKAALARETLRLFGPNGLQRAETPQPTEQESDLRHAAVLRDLAARGMCKRKYSREAERLEAKWSSYGKESA